MDRDYRYYQAKIREAERLRSEAIGDALASVWSGAAQLVARAYHALLAALRPQHPVHH